MDNPWEKLSESEGRYVLEMDRKQIQAYNSAQKESSKPVLESIPEPFIGNPETARVVLLLLNPGHSPEDPEAHRNPAFKSELFQNLRHELSDYPFYPLNPAFSWTPTANWWIPRTRELRQAVGLSEKQLSAKLMAVEWFPYHSKNSGLPFDPICESQQYSFDLVRRLLDNQTLVVRMRSKSRWEQVDRRTLTHALKNPQCSYISKGNTDGDLFDQIVKALIA